MPCEGLGALGDAAKPLAAYRRRLCWFNQNLMHCEIISTSGDTSHSGTVDNIRSIYTVDNNRKDDRFAHSRDNRRRQLLSEPSLYQQLLMAPQLSLLVPGYQKLQVREEPPPLV